MRSMRITAMLTIAMACGAGSPRRQPRTPPAVEQLLVDAGYQTVWPWTQRRLDADGRRVDEHELGGGSCLAVLVADPRIEIFAGGAQSMRAEHMTWLVGCAADDGPIEILLRGSPGAVTVVGLFVGPPEANAHVLLAQHFGMAIPSTAQAPTTLEIHDNACDEDTARAHYQRGMELAREESFAEAAAKLALAYACHADGTILFNLATVTAQRGMENEAREMYGQLLRDHPSLPRELHVEVNRALDRLLRPGTIRVRVEAEDRVFVNGVRVDFRGSHAIVEAVPGAHEVIVRSADGERHEVTVQLRSGQEMEIDPRVWVQSADAAE